MRMGFTINAFIEEFFRNLCHARVFTPICDYGANLFQSISKEIDSMLLWPFAYS